MIMTYEEQRKRQIRVEIDWLKNKLKTISKPKHRKDIERQIKESEYNLYLGVFN
jgi:hypothetical protein